MTDSDLVALSDQRTTSPNEGGKDVVCQVLHNKHFNRTQNGKIHDKDLKDIFALLVLNLDLRAEKPSKKYSLYKSHPYTFTVPQAIALLENLEFSIDNSGVSLSMSYNIDKELALMSLKKFFAAKLFHCPGDRTRNTFSESLVLQPTPKGVAIVSWFTQTSGIRFTKVPAILMSSLNSMNLFSFERNFLNYKINFSKRLVLLLYAHMLGLTPNVWSPTKKTERFQINLNLDILNLDSSFSFDYKEFDLKKWFTSPLAHKYFTNPESDAFCQYFVSESGIRVFQNRNVANQKIDYCVSGKAVVQWLMDCTDILSDKAALEIGRLFVKYELLLPLTSSQGFEGSHESFYRIKKHKLTWNPKRVNPLPKPVNKMSEIDSLKLNDILVDPGLKHLFKEHLLNEYCAENIQAYDQLQIFVRKLNLLSKLLVYVEVNYGKGTETHKNRILKLANDCLATIYHTYFMYLSPHATSLLNIDYNLRQKIVSVILGHDHSLDSLCNDEQPCSSGLDTSSSQHLECTSIFSSKLELIESPPSSPGDQQLQEIYRSLLDFAPVVNELLSSLYGMMEVDSYPKFLESSLVQTYKHILG